jgi:GDP-L-fucose synthase
MQKHDKIYIAGHRGLAGSAIVRCLLGNGYDNLVYRTSKELDLTRQSSVEEFFASEKPDYVFLAAAKVGGIHANSTYPAQFIYSNLQIQNNVIHSSHVSGVKKLLFLGSSCIYPRMAPQPMPEESLLTGELEPTNEPYAVAKIAGIRMCQSYRRQYGSNFIAVMPTNLYGVGDNYHETDSHVLPGLIRRFNDAKVSGFEQVSVWGSGRAKREFLFSDDLADACVFLMNNYNKAGIINIGTGEEVSIADAAEAVKNAVGYRGRIVFNASKPDGTPRKLLDTSKIRAMGWKHKTSLEQGLAIACDDYFKSILTR